MQHTNNRQYYRITSTMTILVKNSSTVLSHKDSIEEVGGNALLSDEIRVER